MCGILGVISKNGNLPSSEKLMEALHLQNHRGPDSFGKWSNETVYLGMQRLSILDIENGYQPLIYGEDDYVLVFNGEIYNHEKLKIELRQEGVKFDSYSDTEVLLKAYICWGIASFDKLEGMFSFALFDKKTNSVLIVRDRIGEKPLYLYEDDKQYVFSSEIKSACALG